MAVLFPVTLILAADSQDGLARNGDLPWHLPADLARFKRLTVGSGRSAVLMGRTTWDTLPPRFQPLPERVNIVLTRGSGGSGLSVRSEGRGLKLVVDGKDIGPLPQELPDLAPGDHQVKIDGGDRYEPFEKTVTVSPDQMLTLEPKLKVKKGLATIKPGLNADGAKVVLVSGSERRPVPSLPLAVDIPGDKPYSVVATKRGFQDFEHKLEFEDGQAERTFVVDMVPPVAGPGPGPVADPRPHPPGGGATTHDPPATKPPVAPAGNGTLTLNSIPVSNVILDGRPLGSTPKLNVSVAPGNHTVIFVHPEMGRKAKSVTVTAGKSIPVVVKF